jgi:hypothetical protein
MTTGEARRDVTLDDYWKAVRGAACAACADAGDDRSCGLQDRLCALAAQLPLVVGAVLRVRSGSMDDTVQAIEDDVCRRCHESDSRGRCVLRDGGGCALRTHLPLVVDAIAKARAA